MKVTEQMIVAFGEAWHASPEGEPGDRRRAGLQAVLALLDPVPSDVDMITDRHGDVWRRTLMDQNVWTTPETSPATAAYIVRKFGPVIMQEGASGS